MAEVQKKPVPASEAGGALPGVSGAKPKRPSSKLRAGRTVANVASKAGAVVPGPWAKALSVAGSIATSVIDRKMAAASGAETTPPAGTAAADPAASPAAGGTEAKLAALMGGGGGASGAATGAVAIGSKLICGVLVSPEPYDSETGTRLAVAARVYGAANALELAVSRLIDLPAGQLLTFVMNRGYR